MEINGYRLTTGFSTIGGGQCEWAFAEKGGKEYFLKKFLFPKFPTESSAGSPATKAKKLKDCVAFEADQKKLFSALALVCKPGGNLVGPYEFFRDGSTYYKSSLKVDRSSLTALQISKLSFIQKITLMKTVTHSLMQLHGQKIIHGDLKPDNILTNKMHTVSSDYGYVTKLIDMDDSYFVGAIPPVTDDSTVVGTPEYYSPELAKYLHDPSALNASRITGQSDIFALGVIFHEFFYGRKPEINSKYNHVWQSISEGSPAIPFRESGSSASLNDLLFRMLSLDPVSRPDSNKVLELLKLVTPGSSSSISAASTSVSTSPPTATTPTIRISGTLVDGSKKKEVASEVSIPIKISGTLLSKLK